MSLSLPARVGSALTWRTVQFGVERGLSIARFVVLAWMLSPADFGLLAIATVVLDLLATVTNLGLQQALVQLEHPQRHHYDTAWTVSLIRGAVISLIVFFGARVMAGVYQEPLATPLLQLLAIRPLLSGLASPRLADLDRQLEFRALAKLTVITSVAQTVLAIALAPLLGVYAIAAGMVAAAVIYVALSYRAAPYRPRFRLDRTSTGTLMRFGRWVLVTSLIGILGEATLRAVISRHLGAADLGLYYLAFRLAYLPADVTSTVVGSVAFPVHARLRDDPERAARALATNLRSLIAILVPAYVVLIGLASPFVRDVLGRRWVGTEELIAVLAIAATIGLVADAVFPMFQGRGEPYLTSLALAIRTVVLLALAWPFASNLGILGAALATLAAEVPVQLVIGALARRRVPRPFRGVPAAFVTSLLAGVIGLGVGWAVVAAIPPPFGAIPAATVAGVVALGTLAAFDRIFSLRLAEQLVQVFPGFRRVLPPRSGRP